MSVAFKMVPKKNMLVSPPETHYYPCAVSQGAIDLEGLSEELALRTSLTPADCYSVILGLTQVVGEALAAGKIVSLNPLGSLKLTLQGTPATSEEPLGKANIKKVKVIYKPSKELVKKLNGVTFQRIR